jgi:hypothetical protein
MNDSRPLVSIDVVLDINALHQAGVDSCNGRLADNSTIDPSHGEEDRNENQNLPPAYPVQSPGAKTTCLYQLLPSSPSPYKKALSSFLYL